MARDVEDDQAEEDPLVVAEVEDGFKLAFIRVSAAMIVSDTNTPP